jgi:protein-disulfide isomerase
MDINTNPQEQLSKKQLKRLAREQRKQAQASAHGRQVTGRIILWVIVLIVLAGIGYGLVWLASKQPSVPGTGQTIVNEVRSNDWVTGNPSSSVILVEYSDFQCPACGAYFPVLQQLEKDFAKDVAFIYRPYPLTSIHPNALPAAIAAEAAGRQGAFWPMHDLLYTNQAKWSGLLSTKSTFIEYAKELKLNVDQFTADLGLKELRTKIDNGIAEAGRLQLPGTPTFFLNGVQIQNPRNYAEFKSLLSKTIAGSTTNAK